MTPLDLEPIRARCEAATPGPWKLCGCGLCGLIWSKHIDAVVICASAYVDEPGDGVPNWQADARFAAHARADVPALLAEVERLRKLADAAESALAWLDTTDDASDCDDVIAAVKRAREELRSVA